MVPLAALGGGRRVEEEDSAGEEGEEGEPPPVRMYLFLCLFLGTFLFSSFSEEQENGEAPL